MIHFCPSKLKSFNIQNDGFHAIFSFEVYFEVDAICYMNFLSINTQIVLE